MELQQFDAYVFDLDGVVWRGPEAVPGVAAAINSLRRAGRQVRFLTNNARMHRAHQCDKLRSLGIEVKQDEMVTAGSATAAVLRERWGSLAVYVMGSEDLRREMADVGHRVVDDGAECVVAGLDFEFSYAKLDGAFKALRYDGARFVACNQDETYPDKERLRPGAGALVAALACAIGRSPDLVVGKPNRPMMEALLATLSVAPERSVMVGDKLDTDILGGQSVGMRTLYVLSGKGTEEDLLSSEIKPDFVAPSAADLFIPPVE